LSCKALNNTISTRNPKNSDSNTATLALACCADTWPDNRAAMTSTMCLYKNGVAVLTAPNTVPTTNTPRMRPRYSGMKRMTRQIFLIVFLLDTPAARRCN